MEKRGKKIMETIEKRLKDYKGYELYKVYDKHNGKIKNLVYMANTKEGDNVNCMANLSELKRYIDTL